MLGRPAWSDRRLGVARATGGNPGERTHPGPRTSAPEGGSSQASPGGPARGVGVKSRKGFTLPSGAIGRRWLPGSSDPGGTFSRWIVRKGAQKGSRIPNPRAACRKAGTSVKGGCGEVGLTGRVCESTLEGRLPRVVSGRLRQYAASVLAGRADGGRPIVGGKRLTVRVATHDGGNLVMGTIRAKGTACGAGPTLKRRRDAHRGAERVGRRAESIRRVAFRRPKADETTGMALRRDRFGSALPRGRARLGRDGKTTPGVVRKVA